MSKHGSNAKYTNEGCRCTPCREAANKRARSYRAKKRDIIERAKGKPCKHCGGQFPAAAMDFHHRNPATKDVGTHGIGGLGRSVGLRRLHAEIAKCDVLCANCHRIHHSRDKPRNTEPPNPPRGRPKAK